MSTTAAPQKLVSGPPTRRSRAAARARLVVAAAVPFAGVLIMWQLFSAASGPRSIFLPPPASVLTEFVHLFRDQSFASDILISIYRVTVGFVAAAMVAVPVGLLTGISSRSDAIIGPINDFTRYLPVPALIPLCILWVGIGDAEKVLIIFIGTVFQVVPLVADTARSVPSEFVDVALTCGESRWKVAIRVVLPWCAPAIYDHLRVALGWAWSYLVIAELVAATSGIGHVIIQAQRFIQTPRVLAGIITIGLIGLSFDQMLKLPRRRLFPWT